MVKPKKPEIGVWKTVKSKSRHKHEKEKPKTNKKLPVKSSKQKDIKHASRAKNSKQPESVPKQNFYDPNRQWNYVPMSMPFPSDGSPMCMTCGPYFYMPYSCPTGSYNPWMPASHSYFGQNHVIYREPVINESSLRNNDRFHQRDRSMLKNKHKVIKQVYYVKRDGRLNKNSDLTLGKEKPVVEEQSVNSIDEIVLHDDHGSNNIVEQ